LKILVLGKGNLGKAITNNLQVLECETLCISTRCLDQEFSTTDLHFDVIVDCMDLSHELYANYEELQARIDRIRSGNFSNLIFNKYCYISSAGLYTPSYETIYEDSPVYRFQDSETTPYLKNKIKTEYHLSKLLGDRLIIMRPVSLWSYDSLGSKDGFFADLLESRKNGIFLPLRPGDENIISCMNYQDAAQVIIHVATVKQQKINTFNITAWQWASRKALKSRCFSECISLQLGRRVSSLHYNRSQIPLSFHELP